MTSRVAVLPIVHTSLYEFYGINHLDIIRAPDFRLQSMKRDIIDLATARGKLGDKVESKKEVELKDKIRQRLTRFLFPSIGSDALDQRLQVYRFIGTATNATMDPGSNRSEVQNVDAME